MKQGKRMRKRPDLRISARPAIGTMSLRQKVTQMWANIGWICGLRKKRVKQCQAARRSSRRRAVLGRVGCIDELQVEDDSHLVETRRVSRGHPINVQSELSSGEIALAELAVDLRDELSYQQDSFLGAAQAIVDHRVSPLGQQLEGQSRPHRLTRSTNAHRIEERPRCRGLSISKQEPLRSAPVRQRLLARERPCEACSWHAVWRAQGWSQKSS